MGGLPISANVTAISLEPVPTRKPIMASAGSKTGKPFYTEDTLARKGGPSLERGGKEEVDLPAFLIRKESHNLSTRTRRRASQRTFRTHVDSGRILH